MSDKNALSNPSFMFGNSSLRLIIKKAFMYEKLPVRTVRIVTILRCKTAKNITNFTSGFRYLFFIFKIISAEFIAINIFFNSVKD